jgi:hypothetical protein
MNDTPQIENDGFSQLNPSATDEIVRRGQEAMERQRRRFEDWLLIAEALDVGRAQIMRDVHTNTPTGKRYEKAMGGWLTANGFREINKATRSQLLECLRYRAAIEKWRSTLTDSDRFKFNHPDTVLRNGA